MKKLILLLFIPLVFACSSDDDECREIVGMEIGCVNLDCTYIIYLYTPNLSEGEPLLVNESTYYFYDELWYENEILCWEGEQ